MSVPRLRRLLPACSALAVIAVVACKGWFGTAGDPEVQAFLDEYAKGYHEVSTAAAEAQWQSITDVTDAHSEAAIAANQAFADFTGSKSVIERTRAGLAKGDALSDLQRRELDKILLLAAGNPATIPDVVKARIAAEEKQGATMNSFVFHMKQADGSDKVVTPNDIDEVLKNSRDLGERLRAWEASKEIGKPLRDGLVELQGLRNRVAREMKFDGFFSLQVADYGMTTAEMMQVLDQALEQMQPLYEQLHCWAKHEFAARYGQPVPRRMPAHWLPNRWGQEWPGLVEAANLDPLFKGMKPEDVVRMAEAFYVSMGFSKLPPSFWQKSDLYELPAGAERKKNTHASAWHIDLDQDVRSLMSVKADYEWFLTTHHELGHGYYYLSYSRPEVPYVLRDGANRAFHEGIGELISLAASQQVYLKDVGVLKDQKIDDQQWLLNDALTSVVLLPWSAGVMSHFERDLYERDLPKEQFNERWWQYVQYYQGIDPPAPRGAEYCDAATKTHINDDPAQYYDYALATLIKFQLHEHIATKILGTDVHHANYRGSKAVGDFLRGFLSVGQTRDWNQLLKENTGEGISARAMLDYYKPLLAWLQQQNKGRDVGFRD